MECNGTVKDQERKEQRNGITEEIKTEIMIIKLFAMKIQETKIKRSKS